MARTRRQFLVYMEPDLIKKVKLAALKRDVSASVLVEEAVVQWLAANEPGRKRKSGGGKTAVAEPDDGAE
ncbi:MAG: hypothetical protein HZA68_21040 [Rhodovulum sp.]|nr:hypothetical protein [Rhodovulum sp.]